MLLPPLALVAGGAALAAHQGADAAPETAYLTLLGGWTLGGAALLGPVRSRSVGAAALLAAMALWALPTGPARGAAFGVVLVAAVGAAGWARLRRGELDLAAALGGALAVHALLRAGELLPARLGWGDGATGAGAAAELARALGPPLLAGAATWSLAQRRGAAAAMGTAVVAALAAGGFTVTGALPLLALAVAATVGGRAPQEAADDLATGEESNDDGSWRWPPSRASLTTAPAAFAVLTLAILAVAALALTAMRPAAGALAIAAAATMRLPRRWAWAPAVALLAFALLRSQGTEGVELVARAVAVLALLLPFALARDGAPLADLAAALAVAVAGALLLPGTAGLAAGAALLALSLHETEAALLQRGWSGVLLALAALAAAYPWLHDPLPSALGWLGWNASARPLAHVAVAATAVGAAWLLLLLARRTLTRRARAVLVAAVALALVWTMPPHATNVLPAEGVALGADTPAWSGPIAEPVERVRVVSSLAGAAGLDSGAPVAVLALEPAGGGTEPPLASWTLRAGVHTGEWAADRPDLGGTAPRAMPWWSWLPPPGTYFAHAYASTWRTPSAVPAARLRIVRAAGLPPEVTLSLQRVEVGR